MDEERERVTSLQRLCELAHEKKSVIVDGICWLKPKPAAFIVNMSGFLINQFIEAGMYVYEKEKKQ